MARPGDILDATMNRRALVGRAVGAASAVGLASTHQYRTVHGAFAQDAPVAGGELVQSSGGPEPDTLDPHLTGYQNTASMAVQFLDSLIREDGNYQFHPNLAERWEINDDATAYTFYLKKDVLFHDGTPFNAEAVRVNFDRIVDPATLSRMAAQFLGPYEGAEVVDDSTVRIHFSKSFANFLDGAARSILGFLSPAALQEYGTEIGRRPVGTGYFKFKEWEPSKHILFERNDQYAWGSPVFKHTGPTYLSSFRSAILADAATSLAAFDGGEVQMAPLPAQDVPKYTDDPQAQIIKRVYAGFPRSVFLNVEKPPTDDVRVRQACIHATNRQVIIDISLGGLVSPAYGPLASTTPGYDPAVEAMYGYDPEKAKQLLEDAGWTMGSGDIREKDGQKLSLVTIVNQGWEPYTIPLQAMLKAVGIDMQIQTLSSAARVEANARGDGNLAPLGADSSDPRILEITFRSTSVETGWAWSRYRNAELDGLLDAAAGEADPTRRAEIYSQIQRIIMENALIIPLVENTYFTVLRPNVRDVILDAQGYPWLYDTWLAQ
ncbi:MAG: peptide/nickel transport system substrate-binding protein [Thermomicrobiales bacterium]|nr:peptide/nickel transport system substrate-binding protein [Thermomicrobiales bacterium]